MGPKTKKRRGGRGRRGQKGGQRGRKCGGESRGWRRTALLSNCGRKARAMHSFCFHSLLFPSFFVSDRRTPCSASPPTCEPLRRSRQRLLLPEDQPPRPAGLPPHRRCSPAAAGPPPTASAAALWLPRLPHLLSTTSPTRSTRRPGRRRARSRPSCSTLSSARSGASPPRAR